MSVLQPWVENLSYMQQSVLITAVRAPDGLPKNHVAKLLLRWYRRCVLHSAFESRELSQPVILSRPWTPGGGSFTGPSLITNCNEAVAWRCFDDTVNTYLASVDEVPHHFHLHLMHAAEVIGYEHPDEDVLRAWWHKFYLRCVNDMHLFPEPPAEMRRRLGDHEDDWRAAEEVIAADPVGPSRRVVTDSKNVSACTSVPQTSMMNLMPTAEAVTAAKTEMESEDSARAAISSRDLSVTRLNLPSEHPDHVCNLRCDGQDGMNSRCARLRRKLFNY